MIHNFSFHNPYKAKVYVAIFEQHSALSDVIFRVVDCENGTWDIEAKNSHDNLTDAEFTTIAQILENQAVCIALFSEKVQKALENVGKPF